MDDSSALGLQQLLLAQLAGDELPTGPSLEDMLGTLPTDDPTTAAVVAALQRRREREAQQQEPAGESPGEPADNELVADVLQRLYAEVEILRARNEALADALGACPECWGGDPRCATCRGRGAPGGRAPIGWAYARYVEPAIARRSRSQTPTLDPSLTPDPVH